MGSISKEKNCIVIRGIVTGKRQSKMKTNNKVLQILK